ncbi:MAG TPA: M28 family peptidase [Longimicrobiales bacterium]|nr:M28 family peptidase [Longimicrobiales bacterium]
MTISRAPRTAWAVVVALAALSTAPVAAQECPRPASVVKGLAQPKAAIRYLADDRLGGRLAGSADERCAGDYIAAEFRRIGLEPAGDAGTYFQSLPLASAINPHAPAGTGRNVVARLRGADPTLAAEAVVIGAHYDHLGHGGFGSLEPNSTDIHNGADDNASGVGALLAVAERLAKGVRPARSVVFVAFTGEEEGLLGSEFYASHPAVPLEKTRAMLNMDMVGRLGTQPLLVYGTGTATEWSGVVKEAAAREGLPIAEKADGYGPSDQTSFYAKDVPVLHFFTNVHGDYHKPSDDWEKIDFAGVERVARLVARVAVEAAGRAQALTLLRGAGSPPTQSSGGGYGAYLGTVPDFTPVERGVRLSGVTGGSPADQAGLKAGDVIVGIAEVDVKDLYAMTDALRAHKPGERVEIRFLRDGREQKTEAVLGRR